MSICVSLSLSLSLLKVCFECESVLVCHLYLWARVCKRQLSAKYANENQINVASRKNTLIFKSENNKSVYIINTGNSKNAKMLANIVKSWAPWVERSLQWAKEQKKIIKNRKKLKNKK